MDLQHYNSTGNYMVKLNHYCEIQGYKLTFVRSSHSLVWIQNILNMTAMLVRYNYFKNIFVRLIIPIININEQYLSMEKAEQSK